MKKAICQLLLCLAVLAGCSCRKKPTDTTPPPTYDPRNVSRNTSNSYSGTLVVGSDGTVHVVWCDDASGQFKTYYASKPSGGTWSSAVDIAGNTTRACSAPQISAEPAGGLHVVWDELGTVPGSHAIYVNKPQGGSWSTPLDISSPTTSNGSLPQIGIDDEGKVYVVYDGGGGALYYTIRNINGLWDTPLEFGGLSTFGNPSLAVSSDGQIHVVYENNSHWVMYMHRSAAGVWDSAVDISKMPGQYCSISNITVDNAGNVYAAWTDRTASEVYFSMKSAGDTAWSQPLNVSNSAAGSWIPKMAVYDDGTLNYIWAEDITPGVADIYYKQRSEAGEWSASENISNTPGDTRISGLTIGADGKLHILWTEVPDNEVYYDSYPK